MRSDRKACLSRTRRNLPGLGSVVNCCPLESGATALIVSAAGAGSGAQRSEKERSSKPFGRELLTGMVEAASGLGGAYGAILRELHVEPPEPHEAFAAVLERDTANALSAVKLVLAQPAISSQLIDNLNASIHVRTLLTDIFLLDEIVKLRQNYL